MLINELNEDCLLYLFRRCFSVQELIKLRIVCKEWRNLILIIFHSVHSLKLFQNVNHVEEYGKLLIELSLLEDEHFKLNTAPGLLDSADIVGNYRDKLWHPSNGEAMKKHIQPYADFAYTDEEYYEGDYEEYDDECGCLGRYDKEDSQVHLPPQGKCNFLAALFPNVTTLIVAYSESTRVDLNYLLQAWSRSLTTLSLIKISQNTTQLYHAINSLTQLRRLDLFCFDSFNGPSVAFQLAATFSRLEHLSMRKCFTFAPFANYFGPDLHKLELHQCDLFCFTHFEKATPKFISNLRHLTISRTVNGARNNASSGVDLQIIKYLAKSCTSLQSLSVMPYYGSNLVNIVEELSKMTSLSQLKIYYYSNYFNFKNDKNVLILEDANKPIAQLPNVTKVSLEYSKMLNDPDRFFKYIPHIFPNVETLKVTERCTKPIMIKMKKQLDENCSKHFGDNLRKHSFQWIQIKNSAFPYTGLFTKGCEEYKRRYNAYIAEYDKYNYGFSRYAKRKMR